MNMKKIAGLCLLAMLATACSKDDDDPTPAAPGGSSLNVPSTYEFTDANGNSTVSFDGQAQRLEMLSEMTVLMKTANTSGNAVSAQMLKDMYANSGATWTDADALGMNGSSKQLKNKTAAAPSGTADPFVQGYFESFMDQLGAASAATTAGNDNGGPGQAGVVVSTTNPSKKYLMDANGWEFTQIIEKGLMGAVFYNQIAMNYLGDAELSGDNTMPVDAVNGRYYTDMEHAWDEAFGYFTTKIDYTAADASSERFWAKYAGGTREQYYQTASKIIEAFRKGRAAISANDMTIRDQQRQIIREELQKVVAGTAIHYLNGTIADFADDALRNHQLSEAYAFMSDLPYGYQPIATQGQVTQWFTTLGTDMYAVTVSDLISVRDEIAALAGLEDHKEQL